MTGTSNTYSSVLRNVANVATIILRVIATQLKTIAHVKTLKHQSPPSLLNTIYNRQWSWKYSFVVSTTKARVIYILEMKLKKEIFVQKWIALAGSRTRVYCFLLVTNGNRFKWKATMLTAIPPTLLVRLLRRTWCQYKCFVHNNHKFS